jgi:hypothetical protein
MPFASAPNVGCNVIVEFQKQKCWPRCAGSPSAGDAIFNPSIAAKRKKSVRRMNAPIKWTPLDDSLVAGPREL